MMILPGDVLFVWSDNLIGKLIEEITDGPSHVAVFKDEMTLMEAQGGRTIGEIALSEYLASGSRLEIWTDPNATDAQRAKMVEAAQSLYGTDYDYWLIPLEMLHFQLHLKLDWVTENTHLICSTFANKVATEAGLVWTKEPNPAPVNLLTGGILQRKAVALQNKDFAAQGMVWKFA